MAKKQLNVALIGYRFMGAAHSNAYLNVDKFFDLPCQANMKLIVGRKSSSKELEATAEKWGWEEVGRDWKQAVTRDDIDIVDIVTPNNTHAEMAVAAAKAGKIVFCEKPLAMDTAECKTVVDAVKKSGKPSLVWFNYRFAPAVSLARQIIEEDRLGTLYHMRAHYLQDWIMDPDFPLVWRLKKEVCGSGAHGDLNAHIIDMARFLVGNFKSVCATSETFIKKRPLEAGAGASLKAGKKSKKMGKVTVDDAVISLVRFANGAIGTFEATRFAQGRKNFNGWEINGSKGSLVFNFERMNELQFFDATQPRHLQGWTNILATEDVHPYAGHYWPAGHIIGYEHCFVSALSEILTTIGKGRKGFSPDVVDGLECQKVLDAMMKSDKAGKWVDVK